MNYYDVFIGKSDPEIRKNLGIWYTPIEIVKYMVKSVDQILNEKFHLSLKSDDTILLDPATGTGTFISEVLEYGKINHIYGIEIHKESFEIAKSILPKYVNLIYGNTLQLNEEALGANRVRQEQPVMVVLGNPPYNGNSKNNGTFITELMSEYKDSSKNIGPGLNDDYIKFIRYGQSLIDQNGSGILAYISNNSFIKSLACSKMRESLLGSFDEIYILNLHGDKDENVFSITTPVCISFFVKTNKKVAGKLGKVYYHEIKGLKSDKIYYCANQVLNGDFKEIAIIGDEKYFIPQDVEIINQYNQNSFSLDEIFLTKGVSISTNCDDLVIDTNKTNLENKIKKYQDLGCLPESIENSKETKRSAKHHLKNLKNKNGVLRTLSYRAFDSRFIYDSEMVMYRKNEMRQHDKVEGNVYFNFTHSCSEKNYSHVLFTHSLSECKLFKGDRSTYLAPLYLYAPNPLDPSAPQFTSNLNTTITAKFTNLDSSITDLDIVDYIYGVLNDKAYTTKYNQFLKSNYPKVPYPDDIDTFNAYKDKGTTLRQVHLDDNTQDALSTYNATTNNKIEKVSFDPKDNKLYFNKNSYFDNITQEMFDFKIGASQPLKNWLESRKEDTFEEDMIDQYLNVIYKVRKSI